MVIAIAKGGGGWPKRECVAKKETIRKFQSIIM
jgi:hypothetical protein